MAGKIKIFTDFDGTISINDVGDLMFEQYADSSWDQTVQDWIDGKISSKECFIRGCNVAKVTKDQMERFSKSQKIDPYFRDFVDFCKKRDYPILVLSDGLDFYINQILSNNGFADLEVFANKVIFTDHDRIKPEFPYYELGCLSCGNCKGYHLKEHRKNGDTLVFIGDGYSDRCAVEEADILFAKDDLKQYCLENNNQFYEFNNFKDILVKIKEIL